MNHQAKLIVFDWDGTIMDSVAHIVSSLHLSIQDLALPAKTDEQLKDIIGLGLREALHALYPEGSDDDLTALTQRYREYFFDPASDKSELFGGARELIHELQAEGYLLAVATGKGRNGLDKVLSETGMAEYFPVTRCADETQSKPHPQMLLEIMDYYGVNASETIMIGDTEYDLQMAKNAVAGSIGVTYGVHDKKRLLNCSPLTCVDSVQDLHRWLFHHKVDAA